MIMRETPEGLQPASHIASTRRVVSGEVSAHSREVIVEKPIAVVFNGSTAAVMMASPCDVSDFAYGFALTEGYISSMEDIESFEEISHEAGVEARFWVTDERAQMISERRRSTMGPAGCGLCGIDSLEQIHRPLPQSSDKPRPTPDQITAAMAELYDWQPLKERTRATHAAAFFVPGQGIVMAREDVGRHNALDKLVGGLWRAGIDTSQGAFVISSRVSLELVQKCAMAGGAMLVAASAPTSLAMQTARESNMTLIGFCRGDSFEVFVD